MMANSESQQTIYGMVTKVDSFLFIKLNQNGTPEYDLSREFSLLPRKHELSQVLQILKKLGQL